MTFRAPHDREDPRDKLLLVERLGEIVVSAEAETLHFISYLNET
jgi:hypothetical protein